MGEERGKMSVCVFDDLRKKYNYFKNEDGTDNYDLKMIKDVADYVIKEFDNREYSTVGIAQILKKANFKVYSANLDKDTSGMIIVSSKLRDKFGSDRVIRFNRNESYGHQRFALAHELGHYIFDCDGKSEYISRYSLKEDDINSDVEIRVNRFAAELLMPENEFKKEFLSYKDDGFTNFNIIKLLSLTFEVTNTAVMRRLDELGLALL